MAGEHAAAVSALFNATTRADGVTGTAAIGTVYLMLMRDQRQAVPGFATLSLALAVTVMAAAPAGLSVRRQLGMVKLPQLGPRREAIWSVHYTRDEGPDPVGTAKGKNRR